MRIPPFTRPYNPETLRHTCILLRALVGWFREYETWVLQSAGAAHREKCLRIWHRKRACDPQGIPEAWGRLVAASGCICCTLREDLLFEVGKLAREGRFDYLVIESTGISEPISVAETFTFEDEDGRALSEFARLDTMVTVVDARNFPVDIMSQEDLTDRNMGLDENDDRPIAFLYADQIEFADVILLNKVDLVGEEEVAQLEALLRGMNPKAHILRTVKGEVPLKEVLNTGRFQIDEAAARDGWLSEPRYAPTPETLEYGIASLSYQARRPFHPQRLWALFQTALKEVVRSKGILWLASRFEFPGFWSQAGQTCQLNPGGVWWAATPKDQWPEDEEMLAEIQELWSDSVGDRRQEIVFIGVDLDTESLKAKLDCCLLTKEEFRAGDSAWERFSDPFPVWMGLDARPEAAPASS